MGSSLKAEHNGSNETGTIPKATVIIWISENVKVRAYR